MAKKKVGKVKAFTGLCVYGADGKPYVAKYTKSISVAYLYRASSRKLKETCEIGDSRRPKNAPHHAVRVRIVPLPARAKGKK